MKIGILTNEQFTNSQKGTVGSSRIRGEWVIRYWPEAEEFKIGQKYDAIIFQKAYFLDYMKIYDGIKILDLCDPDWTEGKPVVEAAMLCDAVTVSSQGLYEYLSKILDKPVYLVPDRVDMSVHNQKKTHEGPAKGVVWFGYHHNQLIIDQVLPTLKRLGLDLTVISDLPYFPMAAIEGIDKTWITTHIKNVKYDQETLNEEIIAAGEIVLNHRPDFGKFIYKSDNKTLIAQAIGMPVAKSAEDLERFVDPTERAKEAERALLELVDKWKVEESVREYRNVIEDIRSRRTAGLSAIPSSQADLPLPK